MKTQFSKWQWSAFWLVFVALGFACLAWSQFGLRGRLLSEMSKYFIVGDDFEQMKIVYGDLFSKNRAEHSVAGEIDFPVNTDTRRPTKPSELASLSERMRREILLNEAYSRRILEQPTETQEVSFACNQWQQLMTSRSLISRLVIKPVGSEVLTDVTLALVKKVSRTTTNGGPVEASVQLFGEFLALRRNGVSPLGEDYLMPFLEFVSVYGYGQCKNQCYALGDLFARHGIKSRLVNIADPSHTVLEAELRLGQWGVFDPLLGLAFVNLESGSFLSFAEIRADLDKALQAFGGDQVDAARSYYQGAGVTIEPWTAKDGVDRQYTFAIGANQEVELCFDCSYPWISSRNVFPPPPGVLAFLKTHHGRGTSFTVRSVFPMVELEVLAGKTPSDIEVDGAQVTHVGVGERIRLARFLKSRHEVKVSSSNPVTLSTVAQCSALPFYRWTDAFAMVTSKSGSNCVVTVEYYTNQAGR